MKTLYLLLKKASDTLNRLCEWLVVSLLLSLSILMVVAVFYRYALNNSIYWSGEVSRFLLVFVSFLGSSVAYKKSAHIGIDVFYERLGDRGKRVLRFIIALVFLGFWLLVLAESFRLMPTFMIQRTATLEIPYFYVFSIVPITAAIWIVHLLSDITGIWAGEK